MVRSLRVIKLAMKPRPYINRLAKGYLFAVELVFISSTTVVVMGGELGSANWLVVVSGVSTLLLLVSSPILSLINRSLALIAWVTLFLAFCAAILFPRL